MLATVFATICVFLFTLLAVFNWQKHRYWKSRGVITPKFYPILGHVLKLFHSYRWIKIDEVYKEYKFNGFWGVYIFFKPELFITDLDLIRSVMVKDADHFIDRREIKFTDKDKVFREMLTVVKGEKWKALRSTMSPTFTSGKIKAMFPLIESKGDALIKECGVLMDKDSYVEIHSLFCYYTMDVIGTCAFGIDANCLKNKEDSQFIISGKYLMSMDIPRLVKFIIFSTAPKLFYALGLNFSNKQRDFFVNVVNETVALRQKSGERRGDFLDLLLEALQEANDQEGSSKYPMTMNTIISGSILFLLAGFDTTANSLSFLAYLLAKNPDTQNRLRKELKKIVKADGELNYQNVMEANYLDASLSETLRMYSPVHFIERLCTKTFILPETSIEIQEGMLVTIPTYSIHRDPLYWENPESFRPERFLPENKGDIKPYTYLPFGLGPRNCIGMRFAQLEAKLAIGKLCLEYELELRPGFTEMGFNKGMNALRPDKNGVQLVLKKIE